MFDNINQNYSKANGIDCFHENVCTRFVIVRSENGILFHHWNGKNQPVLGTNTCEIFYREQKSIKMHYERTLNG